MAGDAPACPAPVVTVDGPVGTGKGTISQKLAKRLGWRILDSGALYRLLALGALRDGIALDDEGALVALTRRLSARFEAREGESVRDVLDAREVSGELRSEECANAASRVAVIPAVRTALLGLQRSFREPPGLVADGRDMGTVVFPDAEVKIYLSATPEERAQRRYKQLIGKGIDVNLASLLAGIEERDRRDRGRTTSPLKPAPGAVVIDTTGSDIVTVLDRVMDVVSSSSLGVGRRHVC